MKSRGLKNKILTNQILSSEEVCLLILEHKDEDDDVVKIDSSVVDEDRWEVTEEVIFKVNEKYFSLFYLKGKTEMQEDYFPAQIAEEVEPKEISIIKWFPKKKDEQEEL